MSVDCALSDGSVSSDESFLPDETDTAMCDPAQEAESDDDSNFSTEEDKDECMPNILCPGNVIEYKRAKTKHGSQRASIEIVDDSRSAHRIVLDNNTVLSGKSTT